MKKALLVSIICLAGVVAILAVAWLSRKTTNVVAVHSRPCPIPSTRSALGVTFTLEKVKRLPGGIVLIRIRQPEPANIDVVGYGNWEVHDMATGKKLENAGPVWTETGEVYGRSHEGGVKLQPGTRRLTISYDYEARPAHQDPGLHFKFTNIAANALPAVRRSGRAQVVLRRLYVNEKWDEQKWRTFLDNTGMCHVDARAIRKGGAFFGVETEVTFPQAEHNYGLGGTNGALRDSRGWSHPVLWLSWGDDRVGEAMAMAMVKATSTPTAAEQGASLVSPKLAGKMMMRRVGPQIDAAARKASEAPETILYAYQPIYPAPKRISFEAYIPLEPDPKNKATVSFENVAVPQ